MGGKLKERMGMKGILVLEVRDRHGKLKEKRVYVNVITNVGKADVAGLINGVVTTPFKYIAIGTGTTAESASDTALENEVMRQEATTSRETTNVTNDTAVLQTTFDFTASYAISEAGIFNASTGGDMLARRTFPVLNLESGDSLTITWKIVVS